jgi:hypothetical protein
MDRPYAPENRVESNEFDGFDGSGLLAMSAASAIKPSRERIHDSRHLRKQGLNH